MEAPPKKGKTATPSEEEKQTPTLFEKVLGLKGLTDFPIRKSVHEEAKANEKGLPFQIFNYVPPENLVFDHHYSDCMFLIQQVIKTIPQGKIDELMELWKVLYFSIKTGLEHTLSLMERTTFAKRLARKLKISKTLTQGLNPRHPFFLNDNSYFFQGGGYKNLADIVGTCQAHHDLKKAVRQELAEVYGKLVPILKTYGRVQMRDIPLDKLQIIASIFKSQGHLDILRNLRTYILEQNPRRRIWLTNRIAEMLKFATNQNYVPVTDIRMPSEAEVNEYTEWMKELFKHDMDIMNEPLQMPPNRLLPRCHRLKQAPRNGEYDYENDLIKKSVQSSYEELHEIIHKLKLYGYFYEEARPGFPDPRNALLPIKELQKIGRYSSLANKCKALYRVKVRLLEDCEAVRKLIEDLEDRDRDGLPRFPVGFRHYKFVTRKSWKNLSKADVPELRRRAKEDDKLLHQIGILHTLPD